MFFKNNVDLNLVVNEIFLTSIGALISPFLLFRKDATSNMGVIVVVFGKVLELS